MVSGAAAGRPAEEAAEDIFQRVRRLQIETVEILEGMIPTQRADTGTTRSVAAGHRRSVPDSAVPGSRWSSRAPSALKGADAGGGGFPVTRRGSALERLMSGFGSDSGLARGEQREGAGESAAEREELDKLRRTAAEHKAELDKLRGAAVQLASVSERLAAAEAARDAESAEVAALRSAAETAEAARVSASAEAARSEEALAEAARRAAEAEARCTEPCARCAELEAELCAARQETARALDAGAALEAAERSAMAIAEEAKTEAAGLRLELQNARREADQQRAAKTILKEEIQDMTEKLFSIRPLRPEHASAEGSEGAAPAGAAAPQVLELQSEIQRLLQDKLELTQATREALRRMREREQRLLEAVQAQGSSPPRQGGSSP